MEMQRPAALTPVEPIPTVDPPRYSASPSTQQEAGYTISDFPDMPSAPISPLDRRIGTVSLDDPDVLAAAEALDSLRADSTNSTRAYSTPQNHSNPNSNPLPSKHPNTLHQPPEPLLTLISEQHPYIGIAIRSSVHAYESSKSLSSQWRTSAEYIERNLGQPIVIVGRQTGLESGVRRWLQNRPQSEGSVRALDMARDVELGEGDDVQASGREYKRRRTESGGNGVTLSSMEGGDGCALPSIDELGLPRPAVHRRDMSQASIASLPPYDELRSPQYEVLVPASEQVALQTAGWGQRLIMTTSGLSIAMRRESLARLKVCLGMLRWANEGLARLVGQLKGALDEWDGRGLNEKVALPVTSASVNGEPNPHAAEVCRGGGLSAHLARLSREVSDILLQVTSGIIQHAAGALPENVKAAIRHHLLTMPAMYDWVSRREPAAVEPREGDGEEAKLARRMSVLARTGVDAVQEMLVLVSGTIQKAEEWVEIRRNWGLGDEMVKENLRIEGEAGVGDEKRRIDE